MSQRNYAWRRRKRYVKMMRRLKLDWNQHYDDLDCACRTDPRIKARFADYPKACSCSSCANRRHHEKGGGGMSIQERRALPVERELFNSRSRRPAPEFKTRRVQCRTCGFLFFLEKRPADWRPSFQEMDARPVCENCDKRRKGLNILA